MTPKPVEGRKRRLLVQWFDTLFIMALCFLTLLTTMLLRGKVLAGEGEVVEMDYSFDINACGVVALMFGVYIWYMLTHSERELKDMVKHVYGQKPGAEPPASSSKEDRA